MGVRDAAPHPPGAQADAEDAHRLTALEGLAALSLDALSSVAYGPEAIVIVLAAAGTVGLDYTLPVTLAIVVLLAVLVISYRQVIAAFPGGSSSSRCWCCSSSGSTPPIAGSVGSLGSGSGWPRRSRSRRWWWCRCTGCPG